MRIDKYLWAVRLYKTRSLATTACNTGRITVNGIEAKASRMLKVGDVIKVRKSPVEYSYKILKLLEKRVGAKLVADYILDTTPPEELEKLELMKYDNFGQRDRGAGRPTKRDRRLIDSFFGDDEDEEEGED